MDHSGLYLLDDARFMYLWIGSQLDPAVAAEVFVERRDAQAALQLRTSTILDPNQDSNESSSSSLLCAQINTMVLELRKNKPYFQNLQVVARRFVFCFVFLFFVFLFCLCVCVFFCVSIFAFVFVFFVLLLYKHNSKAFII